MSKVRKEGSQQKLVGRLALYLEHTAGMEKACSETASANILQELFRLIVETAVEDGKVVLPGGMGTFEYQKKVTQVVPDPDGNMVEVGPKPKLVYKPGQTVKTVL